MVIGDRAPVEMTRRARPDPFVQEVFARNEATKKPWVSADNSSHIWTARLPGDLAPGTYRVVVEAVGRIRPALERAARARGDGVGDAGARVCRDIGPYITERLMRRASPQPLRNQWERNDGSEIDCGRSHRIPERFHHRGRHAAWGGEGGDGQDQHAGEHHRDGQKGARTRRDDRLRADHLHRGLSRTRAELRMASSRAWSTANRSVRAPGARRSSML